MVIVFNVLKLEGPSGTKHGWWSSDVVSILFTKLGGFIYQCSQIKKLKQNTSLFLSKLCFLFYHLLNFRIDIWLVSLSTLWSCFSLLLSSINISDCNCFSKLISGARCKGKIINSGSSRCWTIQFIFFLLSPVIIALLGLIFDFVLDFDNIKKPRELLFIAQHSHKFFLR